MMATVNMTFENMNRDSGGGGGGGGVGGDSLGKNCSGRQRHFIRTLRQSRHGVFV